MKLKVVLFFLLLYTVQFSFGQGKLKAFEVCNSSDTIKRVTKGDTIVINCNTAYILNQSVINNYRKALQNNRSCTEIIKTYAVLSTTQDSVISQQKKRFNELKNKFDSLGNNMGQFLTLTQSSLTQLGDTLTHVFGTVMQTQNLLLQTKSVLEQEQQNKWNDRLKWGIGGLGVGLVATTLVFLAVR